MSVAALAIAERRHRPEDMWWAPAAPHRPLGGLPGGNVGGSPGGNGALNGVLPAPVQL